MEEVSVVQGNDWTTHSLSEVGHCWAKLRLRKEGLRVLRDKTDLMTLLNHWWDHGGEPEKKSKMPNAPSDCVAFADSGFEQNDALCDPDAGIPVAMRDLVNDQGIDFDYSPIVCFYALIPGQEVVHILGCYESKELVHKLPPRGPGLLVSDLHRKRSWNIPSIIKTRGECCFFVPMKLSLPSLKQWKALQDPFAEEDEEGEEEDVESEGNADDDDDNDEGFDFTCSATDVEYRCQMVRKWWEHRGTTGFSDEDEFKIFDMLHGDMPFFNLTTDEGRQKELACYWATGFICGHDRRLWEMWMYFEKRLLTYRMRRLFRKEWRVSVLLAANQLLSSMTYVARADVPQREKELYRKRDTASSHGEYPLMWYRVSVDQVSPDIIRDTNYDLVDGQVMITWRDIQSWIWQRMQAAASKYVKRIYHNFRILPVKNELMVPYVAENHHLLRRVVLSPFILDIRVQEERLRQERLKARATLFFNGDLSKAAAMDACSSIEGLVEVAKRMFPLCMAKHVWAAVTHGEHPKNFSRLAISLFLLEAGYEFAEVDNVIQMLYSMDLKYLRRRFAGGKWDKAAYKLVHGNNVEALSKQIRDGRVGAYGCAKLIGKDFKDLDHGCPFAKTGYDAQGSELRALLSWSGFGGDIEDIVRKAKIDPRVGCLFYYQQLHPNCDPIKVQHPNQFFREPGKCAQCRCPTSGQSTTSTVTAEPSMKRPASDFAKMEAVGIRMDGQRRPHLLVVKDE